MVSRNESGFPDYPTCLRARLPGGRLVGTDGSMWLYRAVPLNPVLDASSAAEGLAAGDPLFSAFEELASITSVGMARRSTAKGGYRQVHLLLINVPMAYRPPAGHPLAEYLAASYANESMDRRVLLFGVQLQPKVTSRGFKAAVQSVADTILVGGAPIEDFDADAAVVSAALGRAGLSDAPDDALRLANAWWTHGDRPDVPMLEHADHLHLFLNGADAARAAEAGVGCNDDAWKPLSQHAVTFVSVQDFETEMVPADSPAAWWAARLLAQGALAISIRGGVEPSKVTRAELRRRKRQFMEDINEAAQNGKMERAEQTEALELLSATEAAFASGGAPSVLTDASVVAALSGRIGDISQVSAECGLKLNTMDYRQLAAMSELWPCSNIRANPHLHDIPVQSIAYSGLPSISRVGDADGAQLGFTEGDRQIAMLSPTAASKADGLPMALVAGATGSGKTQVLLWLASQFARMGNPIVVVDPKALALDTRVPTPDGWSTIGQLAVGDQVFGSDGSPCTITHKSRVFGASETRLYDFVFDDGQVVRADENHQWVIYEPNDRSRLLSATPDQVARWSKDHKTWAACLDAASAGFTDSDTSTTYELLNILSEAGVERWRNDGKTLGKVLRSAGVMSGRATKPMAWPTRVALKAIGSELHRQADSPFGKTLTTAEILDIGIKRSGQTRFAIPVPAAIELPETDLPIDPYLLGVWLGDGNSRGNAIACGVEHLDDALANIEAVWPHITIRPVNSGCVTVSLDRDFSNCKYGHDDYETIQRTKDKTGRRCATCEREHSAAYRSGGKRVAPEMVNPPFITLLRSLGIYGNKRIPAAYLRASKAQRMALLQGLMDTDGTVKKRGDLRITMTKQDLMVDICELVRSLGYKASLWEGDATITETDPDDPKQKRTRRVGREWVVTFRTPDPVFRLKHKLAAQKVRCRGLTPLRSQFHYLVDVRPVDPVDAQCLRVDSPDHTYLVGDFVVTHNSGSDHSGAILSTGQGQVASLDDLARSDGVFDPIRFARSAAAGVEMAASMLMQVNPWGPRISEFEVPILTALDHGVRHGAECIGQALKLALEDGVAPKDMVDGVFAAANASPMFRACVGMAPTAERLSVADGITLIKVGDAHLDLPQPGVHPSEMSLPQRVALALVRMMVFGSAMALTGRAGVVMLDEAWVFLGAGKTEVERLGRLARSQGVLPMMFTQRVSDAVDAGLRGYISRGLILPISDPVEAAAACELFELEASLDRISRITAKATIGGTDGTPGAPNWYSMRHLRDPHTGRTLRGSVGIYADLHGRAVPVEVTIPSSFLELASTNPDDIRRRQERLALASEAGPDATPVDGFDTALGLG